MTNIYFRMLLTRFYFYANCFYYSEGIYFMQITKRNLRMINNPYVKVSKVNGNKRAQS